MQCFQSHVDETLPQVWQGADDPRENGNLHPLFKVNATTGGLGMTPITKRELPNGYQLDWDDTIWNVGHVFSWSEPFNGWVDVGTVTVRPGQTLPEAFLDASGVEMSKDMEIFFLKENP